LGLTQEELAWRARLHRTYIADVERGVRNVTLRTAGQLAGALQSTVAELVSAEPESAARGVFELHDILLIEDNPADVEMTVRALRRSRVRNPVRVITDGAEAIRHLFGGEDGDARAALPALILLDLHLPRVPGLEILRRLRADPRPATVPVTVLTVSRRRRDAEECRLLGVLQYIVKPVTPDAFGQAAVAVCPAWALVSLASGETAVKSAREGPPAPPAARP
jgi:CheY-like chemotaxis protein